MIDVEECTIRQAARQMQEHEDRVVFRFLKIISEKHHISYDKNPITSMYLGILKYGWTPIISNDGNNTYTVSLHPPGSPFDYTVVASLKPKEL